MIMYAIFTGLAMLGFVFLCVGIYLEMDIFALIGPALGAPGFLPMSLGFFILAVVVMFIALIGIFVRIKTSGCGKRFDKIPRTHGVFNFIYRDGLSGDFIGERRPGMGIFDLPGHGVIVDVGRLPSPGSVYDFGDKKIRLALQDINFTPNPKFTSIYSFFSYLGFNNMEELQDTLNGYNPSLTVKVWNKLVRHRPKDLEERVFDNIIQMDAKELKQNDKAWRKTEDDKKNKTDHNDVAKILDKLNKKEEDKNGRT